MYKYYGASASLMSWKHTSAEISVTPDFKGDGKTEAVAHYTTLVTALEEVHEVLVEVVVDAEAEPNPPQPEALQDLVQAGRARLARARGSMDKEEIEAARELAKELKKALSA